MLNSLLRTHVKNPLDQPDIDPFPLRQVGGVRAELKALAIDRFHAR
jgi:hypothetical protein